MLPFLKPKTWPRIGKPVGESRYGFSQDDDIIEQALDELMRALESKDGAKIHSAIEALVNLIHIRESNASDSQEDASSV
jgi:hypothetical protein